MSSRKRPLGEHVNQEKITPPKRNSNEKSSFDKEHNELLEGKPKKLRCTAPFCLRPIRDGEFRMPHKGNIYCSPICLERNSRAYIKVNIYHSPHNYPTIINNRKYNTASFMNPIIQTLDRKINKKFYAPPHYFKHAPFADVWKSLINSRCFVKAKFSLQLSRGPASSKVILPCIIVDSAGYFIQFQTLDGRFSAFERLTEANMLPLHQEEVALCPGMEMYANKNVEWKTLSENFALTIEREMRFPNYTQDTVYEGIISHNPPYFTPGFVKQTFGQWMLFSYECSQVEIWLHPATGFIKPQGFCQAVGCPLMSSEAYASCSSIELLKNETVQNNYLNFPFRPPAVDPGFELDQYLEIVDPFAHVIEFAQVYSILRSGYILVRTLYTLKTYLFHCTSPCLYPAGYAESRDIATYDHEQREVFWSDVVKDNTCVDDDPIQFAPTFLFEHFKCFKNPFKPGMILETFCLVPNTIAYAVIVRVVERLLYLRVFFENDCPNYFIVDFESPYIFPVGHYYLAQHIYPNIKRLIVDQHQYFKQVNRVYEGLLHSRLYDSDLQATKQFPGVKPIVLDYHNIRQIRQEVIHVKEDLSQQECLQKLAEDMFEDIANMDSLRFGEADENDPDIEKLSSTELPKWSPEDVASFLASHKIDQRLIDFLMLSDSKEELKCLLMNIPSRALLELDLPYQLTRLRFLFKRLSAYTIKGKQTTPVKVK